MPLTEETQSVFEIAYGGPDGPFTRIGAKLRAGSSVLVYLPGRCIDAAADWVQKNVPPSDWVEYGSHPEPGETMAQVLAKLGGAFDAILKALKGEGPSRRSIFKNLDRLFSDNNQGVVTHEEARRALFSLVEATRDAGTLGLADRTFGKLPPTVESAFTEVVWLDEVDAKRVQEFIPNELKQIIPDSDRESSRESSLNRIARRLRHHDPIQALRLMRSFAAKYQVPTPEVVTEILEASQPMCYERQDKLPGVGAVDDKIVAILDNLIGQFQYRIEHPKLTAEIVSPGFLLFGPPGTGKTYLSRYVAVKMNVPFRVVNGSDLKESLFGQTERNVVALFDEARRASPCVLVLDDADDLLRDRESAGGSTAGAERSIVNTFLQCIEGFRGRSAGVLLILTSNNHGSIDPAVLSRLSPRIRVPFPTEKSQVETIVKTFAESAGLGLDPATLNALTERFMGLVVNNAENQALMPRATVPAERFTAEQNLFSAREISNAMGIFEGAYRMMKSEPDAVKAVRDYYERLAKRPRVPTAALSGTLCIPIANE
jgi:Cdc6-like AAA superfamily ATPase